MIRGNDHSAFRELYVRHQERLRQQACSKTGSAADAEDILQELFIHLWEKRHSLNITGSVPAYLHAALRNRIINYYHTLLTRNTRVQEHAQVQPQLADDGQVTLALKELTAQVNEALHGMPEKMRAVYLKSREEGLSAPVIASELSLSEQTVRNQISNALKRLKVKIDAYYKGHSLPNSL